MSSCCPPLTLSTINAAARTLEARFGNVIVASPKPSIWRALRDRVYGSPELTWILLPPYEVPGMAVVGSVLVENRGRTTAYNVKIELVYGVEGGRVIHHMEIVSDEEYLVRGGGDLHSFVTLRLREMRPGTRVVIYVASHDRIIPDVSVTFYQKSMENRVRASVVNEPTSEKE